jgi:hypothetical protein
MAKTWHRGAEASSHEEKNTTNRKRMRSERAKTTRAPRSVSPCLHALFIHLIARRAAAPKKQQKA